MAETRREVFRSMLAEKPFISLKEMRARFPQLSEMTLRRDIEAMEKAGICMKVRGGARSMKFITTSMEEAFNLRLHENSAAKGYIARECVRMMEPGRSIFLDSGTTALKVAEAMPDKRITVTTSGPNVALSLLKKNMPIVNIVGGMINRDNISVSGTQAIRYMEDINIDIAFLTPSGLTAETGFTCGNYSECEFKQFIIRRARRVVIMMDGNKLDRSLPYTFASMRDVDTIVCSRLLPAPLMQAASEGGAEIIVAKPDAEQAD